MQMQTVPVVSFKFLYWTTLASFSSQFFIIFIIFYFKFFFEFFFILFLAESNSSGYFLKNTNNIINILKSKKTNLFTNIFIIVKNFKKDKAKDKKNWTYLKIFI